MRDNAINALSQQESEAAVILQRMKDYDGQITITLENNVLRKDVK